MVMPLVSFRLASPSQAYDKAPWMCPSSQKKQVACSRAVSRSIQLQQFLSSQYTLLSIPFTFTPIISAWLPSPARHTTTATRLCTSSDSRQRLAAQRSAAQFTHFKDPFNKQVTHIHPDPKLPSIMQTSLKL